MAKSKQFWFPAKQYGWGWGLPTAWQGWAVLLVSSALVVIGTVLFPPAERGNTFLLYTAVVVAALFVICYLKGERPEWRWGRK